MAKSRRTRSIAVAVAALAAAVSLTACQSGGDDKAADKAGASATAPAASGAANDAKTDSASGSASGSAGKKADSTARMSGKSGSAAQEESGDDSGPTELACTGDNLDVTAQALTRPSHYLLLTATNTGGQACNAYYYPMLRFGEDQSVSAAPMEDTKPQAVVTLQPGESAYAGVALGADGEHGRTADSLAVYFSGADSGEGSTGSAAHPALPGGSAYYDDNAQVTYWQREKADAIN
ncbi:DUF4232 domain-containing protein [Streptomyces sp. NPDC057654]|uniref:DUF4232 domain-containing protein n=1 Tax=Streptomyces sp. NPDC057654 TaxID=3346196 RepID=UPI0036CED4F9